MLMGASYNVYIRSHRGPRRQEHFLSAAAVLSPSAQQSHHLCTRRYSSHKPQLAVKIAGSLTWIVFYVRVKFSSLRFALNSRNAASSRRGEARLQLRFLGSISCLQQRSSHVWGPSKRFTKSLSTSAQWRLYIKTAEMLEAILDRGCDWSHQRTPLSTQGREARYMNLSPTCLETILKHRLSI